MRLSVLDQSPVPEGSSGPEALRNTLDLARLADGLGYHRYWLAEHHGLSLAGPEPGGADRPGGGRDRAHPRRQRRRDAAALLAVQGGREVQPAGGPVPGADRPRARPRVGHRPADDVRAPARPPPGLARRLPAAARRAARALRPQLPGRPSVRAARPRRCPGGEDGRRSGCSARRRRARSGRRSSACRTRSPTSSTREGAEIATDYRERARAAPRSAVAVWAICAETDEEAERLASSIAMAMAMLRQGPARSRCRRRTRRCASSARATPAPGGAPPDRRRPETVRAGIEEVAAAYGADEVIVVTITHDHAPARSDASPSWLRRRRSVADVRDRVRSRARLSCARAGQAGGTRLRALAGRHPLADIQPARARGRSRCAHFLAPRDAQGAASARRGRRRRPRAPRAGPASTCTGRSAAPPPSQSSSRSRSPATSIHVIPPARRSARAR